MELPQIGVTGLGGPAGGRDINATMAGPLLKRGFCVGTNPCGFLGHHRLTGGGGCMANLGGDRPHGVSSGLPGFNVATVDKENLHKPPSTICLVWRGCSTRGHAGVGGKGPPLHVCSRPESGGSQRMYIRPQGSGYLGVDPPLTVGQAMEALQGGSGFPGATTVRGAASLWPNRALEWGSGKYTQRQSCHSPRYAGWGKYRRFDDRTSPRWGSCTMESKETTARSHDAWDRTRRHGFHGSAGSPSVRHRRWGVLRTSKWVWSSSCRGEARWHAWRRAGATYLRWLGLPWRHLLWWGRWHSIKIAHL